MVTLDEVFSLVTPRDATMVSPEWGNFEFHGSSRSLRTLRS